MRPNYIIKHLKVQYLQLNIVLCTSYSAIGTWKYPLYNFGLEIYLAPYRLLRSSYMHGKGYDSVFI